MRAVDDRLPILRKPRVRGIASLIGQPGEFWLWFCFGTPVDCPYCGDQSQRAQSCRHPERPNSLCIRRLSNPCRSCRRCRPRLAQRFNGKREIAGRLESLLDILFQASAQNSSQFRGGLAIPFRSIPAALPVGLRSSFPPTCRA